MAPPLYMIIAVLLVGVVLLGMWWWRPRTSMRAYESAPVVQPCQAGKPVCRGPIAPMVPRDLFYWDGAACQFLRTFRPCKGLMYNSEAECKAATVACGTKPTSGAPKAWCTKSPTRACNKKRPSGKTRTSYMYSPQTGACGAIQTAVECGKTDADFDTKAECDVAAARWCTPMIGGRLKV